MLLDDITKNLAGELGPQLESFGLPADKSTDIMSLANSTVLDEFKSRAGGNDLGALLDLFNGNQAIGSSSLVNNLSNGFGQQLAEKFGIDPKMAMAAATAILPMVLSKLNDSTPDSGISGDLLSDLVGGSGGSGLTDMLKGFLK